MVHSAAPTLLHRCALGLWFLGLGALGLVRWWMRYARDARIWSDAVMHVWLWGSLLIMVIGALWIAGVFGTQWRKRDPR
ncbi:MULTISPECIES: hypothetical protein [unclassified Lysobacter]|uniref:hypothetical protein n=1 Tax=unclassified Lysobacter TaxID=2635362 RepID=UPI001C24678B|nr:hypothetical protein [Lysobacter sp. MMG2]MBU8976475.1 hypothetical protein [Lysobacter sp. MMG2]